VPALAERDPERFLWWFVCVRRVTARGAGQVIVACMNVSIFFGSSACRQVAARAIFVFMNSKFLTQWRHLLARPM
jgi:hypothetical protein